jgi:hypothetical protein
MRKGLEGREAFARSVPVGNGGATQRGCLAEPRKARCPAGPEMRPNHLSLFPETSNHPPLPAAYAYRLVRTRGHGVKPAFRTLPRSGSGARRRGECARDWRGAKRSRREWSGAEPRKARFPAGPEMRPNHLSLFPKTSNQPRRTAANAYRPFRTRVQNPKPAFGTLPRSGCGARWRATNPGL